MSNETEPSVNFTKEAFLHPANLVFLLVGTISALLFNDVGLTTNTILTLTFGMELIYLGIVPKLPSYQQSLRLKKRKEKNEESGEKMLFHNLDVRSQKRFLVLKHITKEVGQNFNQLSYSSQAMLDHIRKKMDDLLATYLTLLDMNRRYQIYMNSEVEEEIRREVEEEKNGLDNIDSEKLKKTKERRLNILKKRLHKFDLAREKYLICETHLETIEDAIRFIYEQSITMPNAEDVGAQLDHLLEEMEETTQIIEELDDSLLPGFDSLDKELELAELRKEAEELHKETEKKVKKTDTK